MIINMSIQKGICSLTNKEETIWFDIIPVGTFDKPDDMTVGLMIGCSVCDEYNIDICRHCNIYEELPR